MRLTLVMLVLACSAEGPSVAAPAVPPIVPLTAPAPVAPVPPAAPLPTVPPLAAPSAPPVASAAASPGVPTTGVPTTRASSTIVTRVGPYAVLSLPARGLAGLSATGRETVRHLSAAASATERVAWDQSHANALEMASLIEGLLAAPDLDAGLHGQLAAYLEAFRLSLGPYDARTGAKVPLGVTAQALDAALAVSQKTVPSLPASLPAPLARFWFDSEEVPLRSAAAAAGSDPFAGIGVNFYDGVSVADLVDFQETHPRNARVVKRDGKLVEEIWRAGRDAADGVRPAPRGRMSEALRAACDELRLATKAAEPPLAAYLRAVTASLETGEQDDVIRSDDLWVEQAPPIAASFGFIETDWDPRARKGVWQALVVIDDAPLRLAFQALAAQREAIEARAPWKEEYRRASTSAALPWPVEAVAGSGMTGPILPAEITLPNDAAGRDVEPRTWLLSNVVRAVDSAMDELTLDAFASESDREAARTYRDVLTDAQLALDWLVGRTPCRPAAGLSGKDPAVALKELATPLEFLKRTLVGLHFLNDPAVRAALPACDSRCVTAAYRRLVRHETILLGRTRTARIEDEHHRALRTLVAWLSDRGAVRVDLPAATDTESPIHYTVDMDVAQSGVRELLAETVRIIAEGDYAAAHELFGLSELPDEEVMAPLRARVARLRLPEAYGFRAAPIDSE